MKLIVTPPVRSMYQVEGIVVCTSCMKHMSLKGADISRDFSGKPCSCCTSMRREGMVVSKP